MRAGLLSLVLLSSFVVPALAQDYFPLDELVVREYQYTLVSESGTSVRLFSGSFPVNGTTATILHHVGGIDDGLQQYWEENSEGDKLFHGFETGTGFQHIWTPPFTVIDMPVSVGKTWDVTSQGSSDGSTIQLHFEVVAMENVTVPAGTFAAVTIEMTQSLPAKGAFGVVVGLDPFGTTPAGELYSYADQTGLLRWISANRTDELVDIQAVGVESTTWSAVRALYR